MMQLPKRLIDIIGLVVIAAVLLAGGALGADQLFVQARQVSSQADMAVSTNQVYELRVDGLRTQEQRFDEIEAEVAALRTQIPAKNRLDAVFLLIATAAADTDATVISVTTSDSEEYAARVDPLSEDTQPAAPPPAPAADAADRTETDPTETDPAASDPAVAPAEPTGKTQVPFTFKVHTADPISAAAFLDALRVGPRLLAVQQSTLTETPSGFDLDVSAVTFIHADR